MSSNILAILLIELSFITGGLCTVKSLKKRNDSLYEMSEALSFMSSEIETNLSSVFQIADKLSASPSEIGCFFRNVYENRESIGEKTFLALGISGEISGNRLMINMTKLAKWSSITILTLMTLGFTTYINFVGAISSSADAAAVKAAKTVISTALPVVGGIVSDAASAVLSAALLIKTSAGVFALVVTSALCLVPFVSCAVKMFIFKIVSAIAEGLGEPKLSAILNTIGTSVGLYCALLGSTGIMLFISISSSLKAFSG